MTECSDLLSGPSKTLIKGCADTSFVFSPKPALLTPNPPVRLHWQYEQAENSQRHRTLVPFSSRNKGLDGHLNFSSHAVTNFLQVLPTDQFQSHIHFFFFFFRICSSRTFTVAKTYICLLWLL